MWIATRPASATVSLEARAPTSDLPSGTRETVSFRLLPTDDRNHLDLDTGETFQDYNYARMHKKEDCLIGASLTVRPLVAEEHYRYNAMRYSAGFNDDFSSQPASIFFDVFIEPTAFRELANNIRSGVIPKTITIDLHDERSFFTKRDGPDAEKKPPLEFGWEPDGSGLIWHNKEEDARKIQVESVRFDYAVLNPRYDSEARRLLPQQMPGPERLSEQIEQLRSAAELLGHVEQCLSADPRLKNKQFLLR